MACADSRRPGIALSDGARESGGAAAARRGFSGWQLRTDFEPGYAGPEDYRSVPLRDQVPLATTPIPDRGSVPMFNQGDSAFAPSQYLFQANAAAIGVRFRRPNDFSHTEGSACLMASGGRAGSERKERVILNEGAVTADGYFTEVTGDFVDREAAARLTESQRDTVSDWRHNTLEVATTTECTVNGLE